MNQQPNLQQPLIKRFPTIWVIVISVVLTAVIVGGGGLFVAESYEWMRGGFYFPDEVKSDYFHLNLIK